MSNTEYIMTLFNKDETVYLLNDFEDIVIKLVPSKNDYKCFAKFKGVTEYEIDKSTNLVLVTEFGGKIITKAEYDRY